MTARALVLLLFIPLATHAASATLKIHLSGPPARVVDLPLETYVAAVVAAEAHDFQSPEALEAMAVVARTYAIYMRGRHHSEGYDLCDTTHCQRVDLKSVTPKFQAAAADTAGVMLWWAAKPAFTPFSRDCGGRTEDAAAVWPDMAAPYLRAHEDTWCARLPESHWQWWAGANEILNDLRASGLEAPRNLVHLSVLTRTQSGRASTLLLEGPGGPLRISASSFRFAVGRNSGWNTLRSDSYTVRQTSAGFLFEGAGSGHGVGLCQLGADQMGRAGRSWREILAHYFPGTTIGTTPNALPWQRIGTGNLSVLSLHPAEDRAVTTSAARIQQSLTSRTGWQFPRDTEIRVYPDLDAFRNATSEPGWVAAHTEGHRIDLQPTTVLQSRGALDSTLTHELAHVLTEAHAGPQLPLWFLEGVADYLSGEPITAAPGMPSDNTLRNINDAAAARRAYAASAAMVQKLVRDYGATTVFAWVGTGLPREVTNASNNQPAANRK